MTSTEPFPEDRARAVADLLKVFAHPIRLRLIGRIHAGECSVAELERELGIRQPSLSQHLGELREAGLVTTRRAHKNVFYALTDPRAVDLVAFLHVLLDAGSPQPRAARSGARDRNGGAAMFAVAGEAAVARPAPPPASAAR